jgi:hypothetical protein
MMISANVKLIERAAVFVQVRNEQWEEQLWRFVPIMQTLLTFL